MRQNTKNTVDTQTDIEEMPESMKALMDMGRPLESEKTDKPKQTRTKGRVGKELDAVPEMSVTIIHPILSHAVSARPSPESPAGLHKTTAKEVTIVPGTYGEDGTYALSLDGKPIRSAEINKCYSDKPVYDDIPLLDILFSVVCEAQCRHILSAARTGGKSAAGFTIKDRYCVYVPDLIGTAGYAHSTSKAVTQTVMRQLSPFTGYVGILPKDGPGRGVEEAPYPVLTDLNYDASDNTLTFSSPYLTSMFVCLMRMGRPAYDAKTDRILIPYCETIIKNSIYGARKTSADEITKELVIRAILFANGNEKTTSVTPETLLYYAPELEDCVNDEEQTTKNKNRKLARAFELTWENIKKHTLLEEKYPEIKITEMIPNMKNPNKPIEISKGGPKR